MQCHRMRRLARSRPRTPSRSALASSKRGATTPWAASAAGPSACAPRPVCMRCRAGLSYVAPARSFSTSAHARVRQRTLPSGGRSCARACGTGCTTAHGLPVLFYQLRRYPWSKIGRTEPTILGKAVTEELPCLYHIIQRKLFLHGCVYVYARRCHSGWRCRAAVTRHD